LDLGKRQAAVLEVYKTTGRCHTDRSVMFNLGQLDPNACRPRISELIAKGVLEEKGKVTCPITGRTVRLVGLPEKQIEVFKPELWREALTDKAKEFEDAIGLRKSILKEN